jgi:hypothetical protein
MTERPTKRAVKTTAPPPAPEITWEDAVAEGKRLVAEANQMIATADRNDWRLAELIDRVVTKYNENSLAKFAHDIGMAACTAKRRRTTYRNWKEILKGDPGLRLSLSYAVARELEKHPDRARLIKKYPEMTKRKAADLMKEYRETPESKIQQEWKNLILRTAKAKSARRGSHRRNCAGNWRRSSRWFSPGRDHSQSSSRSRTCTGPTRPHSI